MVSKMIDTLLKSSTPAPKSFAILPTTWVVLGIVSISMILRLWRIGYGLPIIYNVDEGFCVSTAVRMGQGDLNPHIFMWPHFFFYLLFMLYGGYFVIGYAFGVFPSLEQFKYLYFNDPSNFYLIARILSVIASAMIVLFLYYLGKRYQSKEAGLIAAAFFGFSGYHLQYANAALPEATMTLLVICTAYCAYRIYEEGRLKHYVLAGISLGLAVSTKYNAFLVFSTIVFAHFFFVWKTFGPKMLHRNFSRVLLAGGISLGAFFIGTPFALLDYRTFLKDISFTTLATSPEITSNSFGAAALKYIRLFFFPEGWVDQLNFIGVFVVAGIIFAFVRRRKQDLLMLVFPILHFMFFTEKTSGDLRARYLIPMLPFFYLFGAVFAITAMEWIAKKAFSLASKAFEATKVCAALLFCLPAIVLDAGSSLGIEADTGNLARKWIEANIPSGSRILYTDYHGLALKKNKQSLQEFYEDIQAYTTAAAVPKEKLAAAANYDGPAYHIRELYYGWNDENRKSTLETKHLPEGVLPIDYEKFSLEYWRERKFEYAIVFRNHIDRYLVGKESDQFPVLRQFYIALLDNSTLIKEFRAEPPRIAGYHIQIFKLDKN